MKYWWLKKYKGLKIKLIPDLIRDVNTYFVLPKNYKDRYQAIKSSDISSLSEEDLKILLVSILNHEKIKNNKVVLIIDALLKYVDNSMPDASYTVDEMLSEIVHLKNYNSKDKLSMNNVSACFYCLEVFYVDKIKYVNKKGLCLCPYCRRPTLYFDNDFIPMDHNFLRLAKLYHGNTSLGCKFTNIQKLLKKCVVLKSHFDVDGLYDYAFITKGSVKDFYLVEDHIEFHIPEICYKKEVTSKEEFFVRYQLNECFSVLAKNLIQTVVIDLSFQEQNKSNSIALSCFLTILENLGTNPYLKKVILIAKDKQEYLLYRMMISEFLNKRD